jgi:hypothetical protein
MKGKQLNWVAYTKWTNANQFQCAKTKDDVGEDGSQDMLFDEGDGFDEEKLDIGEASEHNLLAMLALQVTWHAFVVICMLLLKNICLLQRKEKKIWFLLMCKLACKWRTRETNSL